MNKLLIVCGPTATGKTKLALKLAKKFNGELISADSRQVYKGMDVGTGKDLPENSKFNPPAGGQNSKFSELKDNFNLGFYNFLGIPLWLYDVVNPDQVFSVADYYKLAWLVIKNIWNRGKLPILVGGTGFYIKAVVDGIETIGIPPNQKLRSKLEKKSLIALQNQLKEINPQRWNLMNNSDKNNKRRLVRAIEITRIQSDKLADRTQNELRKNETNILMIGLTAEKKIINKKIDERVEKRVKQGIIKEIQSLLDKGYDWNLYSMSGLGYKQWKGYFQDTENEKAAIEKWKLAEYQYSKRQLTWFKKDQRINWYDVTNGTYQNAVVAKVASWYL